MAEINSLLGLKYLNSLYHTPKTITSNALAVNEPSVNEEFSLKCVRKSDLLARETETTVVTTVIDVDGSAPTGDLVGAEGWEKIFSNIDLTRSPYNKYAILLRKNTGETTTYDIFINILDDVVSGDGYQISSANSGTNTTIQLFYDNIDTDESTRHANGSDGVTDTGGIAPYVILENKWLLFGEVTLAEDFETYFTNTILIQREYQYDVGLSLPVYEILSGAITAYDQDDPQTYTIEPETPIGGEYNNYVDELDSMLVYFEQDYFQDDFIFFGSVKNNISGDSGAMVGIENKLVYFNQAFSTTVLSSPIYVGSSALLTDVEFTIGYSSDPEITDFDEIIFNKAKVRFVEDGPNFEEYTGDDFDYLYNTEDNKYIYKAPYGTPPISQKEGYTVSEVSTPPEINGFFEKTNEVINDQPVFKHQTENYYIQLGDNNRIAVTNRTYNYFYTTQDYNSSAGFAPEKYSWYTSYGYGSIAFVHEEEIPEEGEKTLTIILYDEYGNKTDGVIPLVVTLSITPASFAGLYMKLVGSSGEINYTGFYTKDSRLFPTDYITIWFYVESKLGLQYQITGDVSCDDTLYDFVSDSILQRVIRLNVANEGQSILNNDKTCTVNLKFKDGAGNEIITSKSIKYIANLHRFSVQNIRPESESYRTEINRIDGNLVSSVSKRRVSTSEYTRAWEDICWPSSHGVPLDESGNIDVDEAIRISQAAIDETGSSGPTSDELLLYDRLELLTDSTGLVNDALKVDNENRYNTIWSDYKKYSSMTNAYGSTDGTGLTYFIVDNTGYTDFRLEFEWFDFDSGVTKIPRNILSPYDGDVLVVYDASDPDSVQEIVDTYGKSSYILSDSTKLKELFAFTGSYKRDDIRMLNSGADNISLSGGGFITPAITTTSRVCLIPYTDSTAEGSGFKLRAGIRHNLEYNNYDLNNEIGEIWVHESPATLNAIWRGADVLRSSGQNYTSSSTVDHEQGIITFSERQVLPVLANYTNYDYLLTDGTNNLPKDFFTNEPTKKFLTYYDDLVDYSDAQITITPTGTAPDYINLYDYQDVAKNFGKIISGYTINKDLGLIEFTGNVPSGRLMGNYYYHTFYRLTNDGYGDLFFYDSSLVPDSNITSYTDWTYVDLKLINEGTNTLTNGVLKFLTRGYISTTGTVDRVLNNNRPWDVQIGTDAETVNCTGAIVATQLSTMAAPSRSVAFGARTSQSASFGTLLPKGITYVRVYWCLATDALGNGYVETTRGKKLYSAELSGRYYTLITG